MQHLLLVLSIVFITVIASNGRGKDIAGKNTMVMKMQKARIKKANAIFPTDRICVYTSWFDMIVN
jgi:hypothetical protein